MTTEALEALDELESRAREAYVSGPGKTVSDLVATLRAALTPPADDEISAIRARHEAARDEPETWTESHAWAHLDRATLLRHVDRLSAELAKERERGWRVDMIKQLPDLYWKCKPHGPEKNEHALTLWQMLRTALNPVAFPPATLTKDTP